MEVMFASCKNSPQIFLLSNTKVISYGELHEDLCTLRNTIKENFNKKQLFVIEANNNYETYLKFLSLILENHIVFLSPSYQFNDFDFRILLENETLSQFHYIPLSNMLTEVEGQSLSSHPLIKKQIEAGQPGFIVRTSGTSGKKFKFILHAPDKFIKKNYQTRNHFETTLAFFPADSIAGIETLLEVVTFSNKLVTDSDKLTPAGVSELIEKYNIDYLHATPSFLNLMLITGVFSKNLTSLKKIGFGSEPISKMTILEIKKKLPSVEFKHIYGMSEIGLLSTITNQEDPSTFRFDNKINQERVINNELEVQSPTKSIGYLNYENIEDPWFKTEDVVSIDTNGFLKVIGRADDLINMAGKKFYPSEVEDLFLKMADVQDVVVVTEKNDIVGNIIIAKFFIDQSINESEFRQSLKTYCESEVPQFMCPHKVILLKEPPVTSRFKKSRTS